MSKFKLIDIHNHTLWSDGINSEEEVIKNAIKNGLDVVGICDHLMNDKTKSVAYDDLESYIRRMNELKETYEYDIDVKVGIEICMNRIFNRLDDIPYDLINQLDFVLLEFVDYVSFNNEYERYNKYSMKLKNLKDFCENIKCKVGLAHTNLFIIADMYNPNDIHEGLEEVVGYLKKYNIFWELNVYSGYRYYDFLLDNPEDKEVKKLIKLLQSKKIEVIVGTDIHNLEFFDIEVIKEANEFVKDKFD